MTRPPRVAVVGGGIAGLAAAYEAGRQGAEATVLDAAPHPGGKIRTAPLRGHPLDAGPDAFLARVPDATELCRELGLGDRLVSPAVRHAYLWSAGGLVPFPTGLVLGVPTDVDALARTGLLSPAGLASLRADAERSDGPPLLGPGEDTSIGELIRRSVGRELLDTLVDPLLAGILAGDTDELSVAAAAPQLAMAARRGPSLVQGARAVVAASVADPDAPIFHGVVPGMGSLVDALVDAIGGPGRVRCGQRVDALYEAAGGAIRLVGPGLELTVDGVVVAAPAPVASRLVAGWAPGAAATLADLDYASVVVVCTEFDPADMTRPLDGSGFLVPRPFATDLLITAVSWASSKFAHHGVDGRVRLRVSAGRSDDSRAFDLDDGALVERVRADLATTMGIAAAPTAVRVDRWPRSLPQYRPGHLDRMARAEAELAGGGPAVVLAGAALAGVGLPVCIGGGRRAALDLLARLG